MLSSKTYDERRVMCHSDALVSDSPHMMIPKDCNRAENFLLLSNVVAIITHYSYACSDEQTWK